MWLAQREDLAKRFRVVTPDLRGFGGSVLGEDDPSVDVMAEDIAAMLRSKGIDRAVIGGLGLGGSVAIEFCRRHLDRVLGLVLANTKASADPPDIPAERLPMADRIEAEDSVRELVDAMLPKLVGPTTFRQRALVYGRVRGLVQSTPPKAAAWALRAMASRPDAIEDLKTIRVPALVIAGSEDELATEDDARAMADALPNAELMVIPRCGHLTAVEQPELFNQAVAEFVTALARMSS
jgi:pimeloyl-ACP methyl ester carboxylesterase